MRLAFVIFALLGITKFVQSTEFKEENDVLVLDRATFKDAIKEKDTLLVEFYAPWCGHCKDLEPKYAAAAKQLKDKNIALAKVDATVESGLAGDYGVEGYPTMKIFKKSLPGEAFDYEGPRDTDGIVQFMLRVAQPDWKPPYQLAGLKLLTPANVSEALEKQAAWLVGFVETQEDRNLLEAVADKLKRGRDKRAVGWIDASDSEAKSLALSYGFGNAPAFGVVRAGQSKSVLFGYEPTSDNLEKFYRAHSAEAAAPQSFDKLSALDAVGEGLQATLIGQFALDSPAADFLANFIKESGFMLDRGIEGGRVTQQLAQQLGLKPDTIYARKPSKLLAKGEQQLIPYSGQLVATELKKFFDTASMPLVGYYAWNTKDVYRKAQMPVCLFFLSVAFKGESLSSTQLWQSKFAPIAAQFKGKVLFAMADDEQEEELVKSFNLDDSSADVDVGCYDADKRRFAMPEQDSFDASEVSEFVRSVLSGKAKQVIRSVTARAAASLSAVLEVTGSTFKKLVTDDKQRSTIIIMCDFELQPCKHSLQEFTAAAQSDAAKQYQLQFAKLDTKFNDAPGAYFYKVSPSDLEMSQPLVMLGKQQDKASPVLYKRDAVAKDYIIEFLQANLKPAKSEL